MNFYNDIDKNAAAWTQQLITNKLIPDGVMLCKSITDIQPHELDGFTQAHWFNGISGWARALDLAGWPATRPIWCASLPCQPFSCAGKGDGIKDERHLWPVFFQLVKACKPVVIVGEQVEAAIGHGWLDGVFADLEGEGYTCGAVIVGAHSVKAPHRRQRIYWVANTKELRQPDGILGEQATTEREAPRRGTERYEGCGRDDAAHGGRADGSMADTQSDGRCVLHAKDNGKTDAQVNTSSDSNQSPADKCGPRVGSMGHPDGAGCPAHGTVPIGTEQGTLQSPVAGASDGRVAYSEVHGCCKCDEHMAGSGPSSCANWEFVGFGTEGSMAHTQHGRCEQRDTDGRLGNPNRGRCEEHESGQFPIRELVQHGRTRDTLREGLEAERTVETGSCPGLLEEFWGNAWHLCRDNKWRRIPATADAQPVFQWLAHGLPEGVDDIGLASLGFPLSKTIPNRVALLKGYGNAIVPQVAAEFLKTVMDILDNKSAT